MFKSITKDIYTKVNTIYPVPPAMNHMIQMEKPAHYTSSIQDIKNDKSIIVLKNTGILKKV